MGVRLAFPQIKPGNSGFFHTIYIADWIPVVADAKVCIVFVKTDCNHAVLVGSLLFYKPVTPVIGYVGILHGIFVNGGSIRYPRLCIDSLDCLFA